MDNLNRIISDLQSESRRLGKEMKRVRSVISVLRRLNGGGGQKGAAVTGRSRRRLSAAARKRIADAQRARWAKWKAKKAA